MSNKLKEVTFLTVKDLKEQDIVLPGKYSAIFEGYAKRLEVDFNDENSILKDLQEDSNNVENIVEKTSENLSILHKSTGDARKAIINRDEKSLESIYKKLDSMQDQINYLQKELFSDSLTKAYNRKWFRDHYLIDRTFPEDGMLSFIDLNKFKTINDTYGHLIGDQVLKYLVKFLQKELDFEGVHIIRYAGDEFLIIFSSMAKDKLDVKHLMKDAQEKLSRQRLKTAKINNISFSFSYGLVEFEQGEDLEDILNKADELMYENKEKSR